MFTLKTGNYYRTRDGRRASVAFGPNDVSDKYQGVVQHSTGMLSIVRWDKKGRCSLTMPSPSDILSEWQDEDTTLNISPKDVGRKVRTRDNSVILITGFREGRGQPVYAGNHCYCVNGYFYIKTPGDYDIVEFID